MPPIKRKHAHKPVSRKRVKSSAGAYGFLGSRRGMGSNKPGRKVTKIRKLAPYGRKKELIVRPPPSGLSHSYSSVKYKNSPIAKIYKALTNSCTVETFESGGVATTFNTQSVTQLSNVYTGGSNDTSIIFNDAIAWLNIGTTTASSPSLQTYQKSFKFELNNVISTTLFCNQSPSGIEIELLDCVAKLTKNNGSTPYNDWHNGLIEIGAASNGELFPYSVPTTSKLFNINWNIVKRTKVELGPGRSHEHVFDFKPNRIVDTNYFVDYEQVKGLTHATMIIVRGMLSDSSNTQTVGTVGFSPAKLIWVRRKKYVTRVLSSNPRSYYAVNNLNSIPATLYEMSEGSGAPVSTLPASTTFG